LFELEAYMSTPHYGNCPSLPSVRLSETDGHTDEQDPNDSVMNLDGD